MAGVDLIIAGQGRDLCQRLQFDLHAAALEIRAAAGAGKERVAGEERVAADERHAAGGVAGRLHDAEGQTADLDLVAFLIKDRALGRDERVAVERDGRARVERVHVHGRAGLLVHGVDGAGVVVVTVREQDGAAGEVVVLQIVEDGVGLVARVDDGALERGLVGNDVAVGHEVPDGQTFDEHGVASFIIDRYRAGW